MPGESLSDIKAIRQRARQHIERGAVTEEEHADDTANLLAALDPAEEVD